MKALNIGCGMRFHPAWTNIDITCSSPHVRRCDVRKNLPFSDESFDVVYHSHLLEHLPKQAARPFLRECYRVLRKGGIVRVAVPDLEQIARLYLRALDKAVTGDAEAGHNHAWMMLELYDQAVRDKLGGEMLEYLRRDPIPNEALVYERLGEEARQIISRMATHCNREQQEHVTRRWRNFGYCLVSRVRAALVRCLLGRNDYQALILGRFRLSGEVHQWMYDRYSLARLLRESGFNTPIERSAFESSIENWRDFKLDADENGKAYKPDSIYVEAIKPHL